MLNSEVAEERTRKFWSIREVALLKGRHCVCTPTELSVLTGHSIHSVYSKLRSLKLVLTERVCRQCGDVFVPTHRGHIYCSKRCCYTHSQNGDLQKMHIKVATFHILTRNHVYTYMAIGTVNHCLFTWTLGVPIHGEESRAIGTFYARPQKRVKKGWSNTMREKIIAHRQNWLKQGGKI